MKTLLTSLVLAVVVAPSIVSASFTCKDIWPDQRHPEHKTFYVCRDLSDIKSQSIEKQEFWKGYY